MKLTFHDWLEFVGALLFGMTAFIVALLILVGAGVVALKIGSMLCGEWCL